MKHYTTPALVEYGTAASMTADSRDSDSADVFFDRNGNAQAGVGGSLDTCVTANDINCVTPGIRP